MSQMQKILDAARANWKSGQADDAFKNLIEAIELLSKGQQQTMQDVERLDNRTIGSQRIG